MECKKLVYIAIIVITILTISPVDAKQGKLKIIPVQDKSNWTCFDYSTDYAKNNPEWGIVTMSSNQEFRGVSHMVNYQMVDNETMMIHDGLYDIDYKLYEWRDNGNSYHFWINGAQPVRYYQTLQDNSNQV